MAEVPDEKSFIPKPGRNEEDAWVGYYETVERLSNPMAPREDRGAYLPTPREIRKRIGTMRWLQEMGFDNVFINSVMQHECPTIELVRQFISKYGPEETKRRLGDMIITDED